MRHILCPKTVYGPLGTLSLFQGLPLCSNLFTRQALAFNPLRPDPGGSGRCHIIGILAAYLLFDGLAVLLEDDVIDAFQAFATDPLSLPVKYSGIVRFMPLHGTLLEVGKRLETNLTDYADAF
jgi:hypothetical protein